MSESRSLRPPHVATLRYEFRPLTRDALPTVAAWLKEPHVAAWWGDADEALREIEQAIADPATTPLIVEMDGREIGYIQSYDPHLEDGHPYRDQPVGTLGMDVTIGDPALVGKGHGSAIVAQFVEGLFAAGTPRVVIDPDPANGRAIRAYEKAGFTAFDTRTTIYGPALMMARDAKEEV